SAIIVAAGSGKRMNLDINKQFIKLQGKEIIAITISKFYNNPDISEIIVCIKEEEKDIFDSIFKKYNFKNIKIAFGGKERQDTINNGLNLLDKNSEIVLIHDGARPFVSEKIIKDTILSCMENKAVIVAVPVKDTIKIVQNGEIQITPNRANIWAAQTPQVFQKEIITNAYKKAYNDNFYGTDDSSLVERIGYKVKIVSGNYDNIKITSPEDLSIAESILNRI
ncbi:MAG: 2-C-methyl-D-erythritol 4-phosphate cytidylyltransferase, partial [Clostridioides sp.]|nr:2-C-methyl-D-erythritol 4-phosphate cytidylyltransferase [Clostridioides sp.]